ncbi:hypothetical protein AB4Z17_23745 [Paenibacillus sp. TAF43_2]|uniref:hypothetical protein n=1 Tax=Paenibacillus sp. TAF43_2 TaxID=3233069 RepID=UPI003F9D2F91
MEVNAVGVIGYGDQIAIIVGLFGAIAGIVLTVVGLIVTAYTIRRGNTRQTPTGEAKAIMGLLTLVFSTTLWPVVVAMAIIVSTMKEGLVVNGLFELASSMPVVKYVYIFFLLLNGVSLVTFISRAIKIKAFKHGVEIAGSAVMVAATLTIMILSDNHSLSLVATLCFTQIAFGVMQMWSLIRAE